MSLSEIVKEQHRSFLQKNTSDEGEVSLPSRLDQPVSSILEGQDSSKFSLSPYLIKEEVSKKDEIDSKPPSIKKDYHGLHRFSDRRDEEVQTNIPSGGESLGGVLFEAAESGEGSADRKPRFSEEVSFAKDLLPSDPVRKFCPFPAEVKEDDPRRVLLKDVFVFTNQKYEDILNSVSGENDVVSTTLTNHKATNKYFFNELLQRLDIEIAAESKSFVPSNEYRDRLSLVNSFLEVRHNNGCEVYGDVISLTKGKKLHAELNKGLKEWSDSYKEFLHRGSNLKPLVDEIYKNTTDLDKRSTLAVWEDYSSVEGDV